MNVGSLFSGIGGFDLGFERAGMSIAWQSEIEPFSCAVLRKHWPTVVNHGDIRNIRADSVSPIDVLCGGFPCQNISVAGKGEGIEGEKSGLWREYARLIREIRPRWVVAENVPALRTRGYNRVANDLETAGYTVQPFVVSAHDIGAPHLRKRIWIIAHAAQELRQRSGTPRPSGRNEFTDSGATTNTTSARRNERLRSSSEPFRHETRRTELERSCGGRIGTDADSQSPDWAAIARGQCGYGSPEPTICGVHDGLSAGLHENRRQRLAALGNSLVPQIAEAIGRAIMRVDIALRPVLAELSDYQEDR